MIFTETPIPGAFVVELDVFEDSRGAFARAFCRKEFEAAGINGTVAQVNWSSNALRGTLRGLHYQAGPATEEKFVRCIRGGIYDVLVDMRPESPTYLKHFGVELTAENRKALYIPGMCAHAYQTLLDDTEVLYQVSEFYTPGLEKGLRFDDPVLGIVWPEPVAVVSEKDRGWPLLDTGTP